MPGIQRYVIEERQDAFPSGTFEQFGNLPRFPNQGIQQPIQASSQRETRSPTSSPPASSSRSTSSSSVPVAPPPATLPEETPSSRSEVPSTTQSTSTSSVTVSSTTSTASTSTVLSTTSVRVTTSRPSATSVQTSTIFTRTTTMYIQEPPIPSSNPSTDSSSVDPTPSPTHLSPTAIALLITLGAFFFLLISIGVFRSVHTCIRRRRREKHDDSFQSSMHSEKDGPKETSGRLGVGHKSKSLFSKSPSSIFGGKERTGLTPNPSWTTFPEAMSPGIIPSRYPLGLVVPPTTVLFPQLPSGGPIGLGVTTKVEDATPSSHPQQTFAPPTITITSSSPRQSSQPSGENPRDISPSNSLNSASVYEHPVYGAQLVKPPKLRLANADAGGPSSDCESGTRNSGWSSWDDNVGIELGVKMDRKLAGSRRANMYKSKTAPSPLRRQQRLEPVKEVSDSETERPNVGSRTAIAHSYSQRRRPANASPLSTRSSPRSIRSPRRQQTGELLYDLPRFDTLSPNIPSPSSHRGASLSRLRGSNPGSKRRQDAGNNVKSSDGSSLVANAGSSQALNRNSNVPSVDQGTPRRDRNGQENKPISSSTGATNSKLKSSTTGFAYKLTPQLGSSPNPHTRVGTLMMSAAYDEDEVENSYVRRPPLKDTTNRPPTRVGLGVMIPSDESKESDLAYVESALATPDFASTAYSYSPKRDYRRHTTGTNERRRSTDDRQYTPSSDRRFTGSSTVTTPGTGKISPEYRDVPSLPPVGGPNLQQIKMMRDQPDYRSPTYSIYGLYRDQSRVSPLNATPAELVQYSSAPTERL